MLSMLLAIIYLAFISLGLPDALLGSAWPAIYQEFDVPVSWSGIVFLIISLGTVVSSLLSDRLTRRLGPGLVTFLSVLMTAAALFGFSASHSFLGLCLWAVPYGLGAGSVDAALNNYVALHYASRHMSWLHCMWGIGASIGPYIMGLALLSGKSWNTAYRRIAFLQVALVAVLFISLPLWKKKQLSDSADENVSGGISEGRAAGRPLRLPEIFRLPGAAPAMLCFFCYCALEQTSGLWASSYLVLVKGIDTALAARYASLFFIGITAGRAISGFITFRLDDRQMVLLGQALILCGLLLLLLPLPDAAALAGLIIAGLGCAPIYPSLLHATPEHFGAENSQAVMGVQMACAYVGTSLMPPIFGALSRWVGLSALPAYLSLILVTMFLSHRMLCRRGRREL